MKKCLLIALFSLLSSAVMAEPIYEYVGSWFVDDGPQWNAKNELGNYTTPVFSGVEAAAYIFGGDAEDYVISTVSDQVDDINFSAWMDGWGDSTTYGISGTPAAQDLHIDVDGDGLYAIKSGYGQAYSAYVMDHGLHLENFAFRVTDVVEPSSVVLLGLGLLGLGLVRKRYVA